MTTWVFPLFFLVVGIPLIQSHPLVKRRTREYGDTFYGCDIFWGLVISYRQSCIVTDHGHVNRLLYDDSVKKPFTFNLLT